MSTVGQAKPPARGATCFAAAGRGSGASFLMAGIVCR